MNPAVKEDKLASSSSSGLIPKSQREKVCNDLFSLFTCQSLPDNLSRCNTGCTVVILAYFAYTFRSFSYTIVCVVFIS